MLDAPANGTLSGTAPELIYTPNTGFSGEDTFTYRVGDGAAESDPATVTVTVATPDISGDRTIDEKGASSAGGALNPFALLLLPALRLFRRRA